MSDRTEGAARVRQMLADTPETVYSEAFFGHLTSDDLAKIRKAIEGAGYTIDSLSGYILRWGYEAAARRADEIIRDIEEEEAA